MNPPLSKEKWNTSILCVDDEEGILKAYCEILTGNDGRDNNVNEQLSKRRQRRKRTQESVSRINNDSDIKYNILTASSGEEAVAICEKELAQGRQIAVGFFDMVMPGGMDGLETVEKIRKLDSQILCAFVTAYTDRNLDHFSSLFDSRDEWLYFNKPFSGGELNQTAYHLVTSWNQRRTRESLFSNLEMMQKGLFTILESVRDINLLPPLMIDLILDGILNHFLRLVCSKDGFIVLRSSRMGTVQIGMGIYKDISGGEGGEFEEQWALAEQAIVEKRAYINGGMAAVPLHLVAETSGAIVVTKSNDIKQDFKLLEMYAIQATNIIKNCELYNEMEEQNIELNKKNEKLMELFKKLSHSEKLKEEYEKLTYLDFLTGLSNRRYLKKRLQEEVSRCQRHGYTLACLMIDIDYFKKINDKYGHLAGDYILQEIGTILNNTRRPYDLVARYGGEEFAIVYKNVNESDAGSLAERVRSIVERQVFNYEDKKISVTVSIGYVELKVSSSVTGEFLLGKADDALYMAKSQGRNRCVNIAMENLTAF